MPSTKRKPNALQLKPRLRETFEEIKEVKEKIRLTGKMVY